MTGEQRIFPVQCNCADKVSNAVEVDLDAAVMEKGLQGIPVALDVDQFLAGEEDRKDVRWTAFPTD